MGVFSMQKNTILKAVLTISIVSIILFAQISSVAAANNQGLEWGIEADNRFDYDFEVSYHNSTFDLDLSGEMYIIINELGTISDDIVAMMNLPLPHMVLGSYTAYWNNGTVMNDFWLSIPFQGAPFVAYPIGNWTLMTELFEGTGASATVTQDSTTLNYTVVDVPEADNVVSQVFLKSNGIPTSQRYHVVWSETTADVEFTLTSSTTGTSTTTTTTSGTTGTTPDGGDSTLILILGGGVAIAVVVIVIVFLRRK